MSGSLSASVAVTGAPTFVPASRFSSIARVPRDSVKSGALFTGVVKSLCTVLVKLLESDPWTRYDVPGCRPARLVDTVVPVVDALAPFRHDPLPAGVRYRT